MNFKTRFLDIFRSVFRTTRLDSLLCVFTTDRNYYSFLGKIVPNSYQYPPGTIRKVRYHGINFEVDIHDYIGHYIYYGFKNPSQTELFALCNPDNIIIDIGTNIGFSLLNMAKITGEGGLVIGFEPDPVNFSQLQKNITLNNFTNIKVTQIGLGDKPGKFILENVIEFNSGGKRIAVPGATTSSDYSEVEVNTLDNFLNDKVSLSKVDLIKIDVEGFEFNVLRGAMNTIRKYSPVLYIELDDNNLKQQSSSAKELIHFLAEAGFTAMNTESKTHVDENKDFRNCHYDIRPLAKLKK